MGKCSPPGKPDLDWVQNYHGELWSLLECIFEVEIVQDKSFTTFWGQEDSVYDRWRVK